MNDAERSLAGFAQDHYGVVTRAYALTAGLSLKELRGRVHNGDLEVMYPGVYRLPGTEQTIRQGAMAATLAAGPRALASHRLAGILWGYPNVVRRYEVTVPASQTWKVPGLTVHRTRILPEEDRCAALLVPVTSPLRTAFDLAGIYPGPRADAILDHGLVHKLFTRTEVEARVELLSAKRQPLPGIEAWLAERPISARPVGSEFELDLFRALDQAGLPRPIPQYRVVLPDGSERFVDFGYVPPVRLGLEPQGYIWHASRQAWEQDLIRDNGLIAAGWALLPVGWDQLRAHPAQVAETVRQALQARGVPV